MLACMIRWYVWIWKSHITLTIKCEMLIQNVEWFSFPLAWISISLCRDILQNLWLCYFVSCIFICFHISHKLNSFNPNVLFKNRLHTLNTMISYKRNCCCSKITPHYLFQAKSSCSSGCLDNCALFHSNMSNPLSV